MVIENITRDKNFFKNLEDSINEEIRDLDSALGRANIFNPEYWPQTKEEYVKWIRNYHEIRGIPIPKGFSQKNKKQIIGMYYGIVHNSKIKRNKYSRLIKETLKEIPAPIDPWIARNLEHGNIAGNVLRKEYENLKDACETYIEHSKK